MNVLAQFVVTLAAVILGLPVARILDNEARRRLRERRHEQLKRAVIAELISRGVDVAAVDLMQVTHDVPPRVTPERVKQIVDQVQGWMKATQQQEHPDAE
jgi:hypothetical protein